MNNDLKISMKLKSSDNINMKLEDSKVINANMNGGIVETDPIFVNSPAYEITYNDINYWNNKSNFSGNYNDLRNKPIIPTRTSQLTNDSGFITKDVSNLTNYTLSTNLSLVATTGLYNDLLEKPTIPTDTSDLTNNAGFITNSVNDLIYYTPTSSLSLVATTGSYSDLINTPTLANVATTGDYNDLLNKPTLSTVASTGDYDDLLDKPTIPTLTSQLTNDSGFITNANIPSKTSDLQNDSGFIDKNVNDLTYYTLSSNLATVATSGSYADLSNTPTIPVVPTTVSSFTNDAGYITNTVNDLTNYSTTTSMNTAIENETKNSYEDISSLISKNSPSDLDIVSAYGRVNGTDKVLQIVMRSNTGFSSGGAASYIFTLPDKYKPSVLTISTCRLHGDYSYASWDGVNTGSTIGYLRIETSGVVYARFPAVSGVTMKALQIHIAY